MKNRSVKDSYNLRAGRFEEIETPCFVICKDIKSAKAQRSALNALADDYEKRKSEILSNLLFESIGLSKEVQRAVSEVGYTQATEIQAKAIPLVLAGEDVLGRSGTGTGKTAAFGIPAVESIEGGMGKVQILILAPTRELAMQITDELRKFAKYKQGVRVTAVYGGQAMDRQIMQLKSANVVVGTPGRVMDHMRRRTLRLDNLKMVILDEADEMLNMGFLEDIQTILGQAPEERQTLLFSATIPPAILEIAKEFQKEPKRVEVDNGQRTVDSIEQYFFQVPQARKTDMVNLLLQCYDPRRSVVFCNTKKMVDELVVYLNEHGFKSVGLHGDMKQTVRTQVMNDFKCGRTRILVATDVCARGIDVEDIDAVFNYDIPQEFEYYIHRIGRTGRAGRTGKSYTLACNGKQLRTIREIERFTGAQIVQLPIPSAADVAYKNQRAFAEKIKNAITEETTMLWEQQLQELVDEGFDLKAVAAAALELAGSKSRRKVPVIKQSGSARAVATPATGGEKVTLRVNLGRSHQVAPNHIVGAIVEETGLPAKSIGKIRIYADHTDVDMLEEDANTVIEYMTGTKIKNRPVIFEIASSESPRRAFAHKGRGDGRRQGRGGAWGRKGSEHYTKRKGHSHR
ncbi:MAG: DEAD/DEAH box helicase [Oscillospiraceae bacterium]|nr:DEAD/DEAH box helicase [Oscillospiraceae bacterium]